MDFTVPPERLRDKLREATEASRPWDRKLAVLQVTDALGNTMELHILVSARRGAHTFDLR